MEPFDRTTRNTQSATNAYDFYLISRFGEVDAQSGNELRFNYGIE